MAITLFTENEIVSMANVNNRLEQANEEFESINQQISSLGGFVAGTEAPSNTKMLWIDTANNNLMKYYNGTQWVSISAAWG